MLYIMRHGRTDWNDLRKLQGRTDIPLNDAGREMADAARKEYADVRFDICFCSPLVRARETAEILLRGRDVPIIADDRLACAPTHLVRREMQRISILVPLAS